MHSSRQDRRTRQNDSFRLLPCSSRLSSFFLSLEVILGLAKLDAQPDALDELAIYEHTLVSILEYLNGG